MVRTYVKRGGHGGARIPRGNPRLSHEFAITLNHVTWEKSFTGWWFSSCPNVSDLCVAEETYHPPLDCDSGEPVDCEPGKHHHVYVKFIDGLSLPDVQAIVATLMDDLGYDLQLCKSRRNWLIYITKEDACPYIKNVRVSELSLFARAQHHFKTNYKTPCEINRADGFMLSTGNFRNIVLDMGNDHVNKLRLLHQSRRNTREPNDRCGWTRKIKEHFRIGSHLYIFGAPGVGKTELIDYLSKDSVPWRCGYPDKWCFGTLKEEDTIALFEDYDHSKTTLVQSTILSIMDKKPVAICKKYENDSIKMFKCVCIFISNYILSEGEPLFRRIVNIEVDHCMYSCVGCSDK